MSATVRLQLPYIIQGQDQPEVTHAEGLNRLDVYVQTAVADKDLTTAPGSPSEGDRYIVGPGATGEWATHDDEIAHFLDSAWTYLDPVAGQIAFVIDEVLIYVYTGSAWIPLSTSAILSADITLPAGGQWVWRDNNGTIIFAIFEAGHAGGGRIEYARPMNEMVYGTIVV